MTAVRQLGPQIRAYLKVTPEFTMREASIALRQVQGYAREARINSRLREVMSDLVAGGLLTTRKEGQLVRYLVVEETDATRHLWAAAFDAPTIPRHHEAKQRFRIYYRDRSVAAPMGDPMILGNVMGHNASHAQVIARRDLRCPYPLMAVRRGQTPEERRQEMASENENPPPKKSGATK